MINFERCNSRNLDYLMDYSSMYYCHNSTAKNLLFLFIFVSLILPQSNLQAELQCEILKYDFIDSLDWVESCRENGGETCLCLIIFVMG